LTASLAVAFLATAAPARTATVEVVVVDPPAAAVAAPHADGLLVPGAGPTTSREDALAALTRGRVRNSVLDGTPVGEPLIELGRKSGADVTIVVALPPRGEQPNNRRYAISIGGDGYRGVLRSESTRIPGLVSIADVAPTVLALERGEEPPLTSTTEDVDLRALDDLIRDKNAARAPAMFLCAALIALLAVFVPRAAVAAVAALLLTNLALGLAGVGDASIVLAAFAAAALLAVPWARALDLGVALAAAVAVYLLALGVEGPAVALSPLGPTQNARFYGLSNVLATLLLAAAVAGVALVARRYGTVLAAVVALVAFVATAGSRFGADGGGAVVLAVAFAVLAVLLYPERRRLVAAAVLAGAALLLGLDVVAGGESHITRALEDGIGDDLVRRAEISWERATRSWYEALYLGALAAALAALAWRTARRHAMLAALAAGLGVSLLVNDSPNEVLVPGVACYLALSRWTVAGPTSAE
jgi:hypothetical protein